MATDKYVFQGTGLSTNEKKWAKKRFKEYQDNYYINRFSDKQLLEELVFFEAIQERYKAKIEELSKKQVENTEEVKKKRTEVVSKSILNSISENLDQIVSLKEKLGLLDKDDMNEAEAETLKLRKFKKWMALNQAVRETKCLHCSKMILLTVRADKYDSKKHPFFWDRYFVNIAAWKLYWQKKITKLELATIMLGEETTLPDYIDWVEKELEHNPKFQELKKEVLDA